MIFPQAYSEIRLFPDDCVCYCEIKDTDDIETSEEYRSIWMLGQKMGYDISASQT